MKPAPPPLPRPAAVIWDMDGTLIDQTAAIVRCFHEVITAFGAPPPAPDTILRHLGGPLPSTMGLFIGPEDLESACLRFRERFPDIMFDGLRILPGALEAVRSCSEAGIPQAILTNKHGGTAREVSRYAGFDKYISICIGNTDTVWQKPESELTRHTLELLGASAGQSCLVGDSPTDMETAAGGGLTPYAVSTGAHNMAELLEAGARAVFPDLIQFHRAFCQA